MTVAMTILALVVAVLAILVVAVLRRLNGIKITILKGGSGPGEREHGLPRAAKVPQVLATDVGGVSIDTNELSARQGFIGFFSASCKPCLEAVEPFLALVAGDRDASFASYAVVSGRDEAATALLARFSGRVNSVVYEEGAGGMPGAISGPFKIRRWPAFVAINAQGRVFTHRLPEDAVAHLSDPPLARV